MACQEELTHTNPSPNPTHSVAVKPAFPHTDINTITMQFRATNFIAALSTYICCLFPPPQLPILPNLVDRFDVYKCITIFHPSDPAASFPKSVDRLCAMPPVPAKGRSKVVPTCFDIVLVHASAADVNNNETVIFPFTKTLPTLNFKLLLMNH